MTIPANTAFAAWDIYGGAKNVFTFLKLLVLIAAVCATIKELVTRRNLFFIIGALLIAIFIYSSYEPTEIKEMGHGIKALLKIHSQEPTATPVQQSPKTDNNQTGANQGGI